MASTRIETSTTASSGGGASGNQMANLRDTLTPIEPIVVTYEAVRSSVGLVIIQSPGGTNAAGPSAPSFTCALVRFDRIDTGERFYCLLSRVPDIGSIPLTQSETGPQGPLAQSSPERALGPGTPRGPESQGPSARLPTEELSRLSLAREPDIARDQQRTADTGSAGDTRPPGHRTAANVLASAPSIALLAEANFQFACGASFHGLDVLYPYCDPEGPVLLELTSKCVTSLHRMGLAFLPICTNTTALQTNAELSMVQYVNGVLCFSKGPIMSTDSDGYRVRYRIASGRGSGGAPLLDENNAVVAVHMSRNEEDPEEKVGQTVRSMVALFFNNRHSNYIPGNMGDGDASAPVRRPDIIINKVSITENYSGPKHLTSEEISDKLSRNMKEAEITTEELDSKSKLGIASVLPQKQLGIDTNKDCDEQLSLVWKSFEVLESKMEIVDSKLDSLTIESAVIPPDAASTTTPDTTHVTTPIVTTSNITKPASISRVRRQRRQRARIECVQDVFCAAENTHIQLTQYSMFLRKREMDRHVAAGAAEASSQAKEQCSLLRLMTAVGRVQFDASRLASSPALYLPSAAVSQSSPTRSASNASNNYRPFVHAYLDTSSNAIRNALQERQHNSMDQLAIILTEASILLWKNLG